MKHSLLQLATASLLSVSIAGCMASGQVHSSASVSAPELVYINPSVQVIADYDEPIFYTSNYYWRYDGGVWYRSSNYTGGWVRIQTAPVVIQQIESPRAYIHFHAKAAASAQTGEARERREERQDAKEQRQEEKAERKEERKDDHDDKHHGKSKGH